LYRFKSDSAYAENGKIYVDITARVASARVKTFEMQVKTNGQSDGSEFFKTTGKYSIVHVLYLSRFPQQVLTFVSIIFCSWFRHRSRIPNIREQSLAQGPVGYDQQHPRPDYNVHTR